MDFATYIVCGSYVLFIRRWVITTNHRVVVDVSNFTDQCGCRYVGLNWSVWWSICWVSLVSVVVEMSNFTDPRGCRYVGFHWSV